MTRRRKQNIKLALVCAILGAIVLMTIFAPWLAPYDPPGGEHGAAPAGPLPGPSPGHRRPGADVLSRVIYGGRASLLLAVVATACSMAVGAGDRRGRRLLRGDCGRRDHRRLQRVPGPARHGADDRPGGRPGAGHPEHHPGPGHHLVGGLFPPGAGGGHEGQERDVRRGHALPGGGGTCASSSATCCPTSAPT